MVHRITAWDGLPLVVREWRDGAPVRAPLLCLPGLVRTGRDFQGLAGAFGAGRRMIAPDYPGRGHSGRSRNVARYTPEACLRDVLDVCAALHVHGAIAVGTSFGGLLAMGLAAARPTLLRGVVLNDIGPEIGDGGAAFVRRFVAVDPALPDVEACVQYLRALLPPLSLAKEEEWRAMARLTYGPAGDGRWRPLWDTRIAALLGGPVPDLWTLFGGVAHLPLLVLRGGGSDILLPETVERMREMRPDMKVVTVAGVGHAPTLAEPVVVAAMQDFLV